MEKLITSIEKVIRNYYNVLAELQASGVLPAPFSGSESDLSDLLDQIGEAVNILERVTEDAR